MIRKVAISYLDGKDTRSMTRDALRKHIAIVLQDTWLFTGTIFENIKYGNENASDEDVYHAAKMARADAFIVNCLMVTKRS